jgi:transposase
MKELLMGVKDAQRLGPVKAAIEGRITNAKGAELTGLSLRQFKRLKQQVRTRGPAGLLHGNRGRPSSRRMDTEVRTQVTALLQQPEPRLNDCHVRDLLVERGVELSAETVRQIRRELGLAPKRRRRPAQHRRRRLRAARTGSLVLIDGTEYAWLGSHQPVFTLVGTLDDATGEPLSLVRRPNEDLHGFTQALRDTITKFGVPEALYGDRTGIAVRNDGHWSREEELTGCQRPTQFGQMLEELGIRYIAAHSPEAKGRIERHWQMVQDRLPAELALNEIHTLEAFDAFLPQFLARCKKWFARAPRESVPAWRAAPRHLDRILACRYWRVVGRDNVVSIPGHVLQIPPGPHQRSYARARVEVRELFDGRLLVLRNGNLLLEQPAPSGPFALVPRDSATAKRRPRREVTLRAALKIDCRAEPAAPSPLPVGDRAALARDGRRPTQQHPWKQQSYKTPGQMLAAAKG